MKKPIVVFADPDQKYTRMLIIRFLEAFDGLIELDAFTDKKCYDEFFSYPKTVDVLVVNSKWYTEELQKQHTERIFILEEDATEVRELPDYIKSVYKYTNTGTIFNKIIAESELRNLAQISKSKDTEIVLVFSASGGTGKTVVAQGISACIAKEYKKVLYINAEELNSFQYFMNTKRNIPPEFYKEIVIEDDNLYRRVKPAIRTEVFDYLPGLGITLASIGSSISMYEKLVKLARNSKEYDVIVLDTDSVPDRDKLSFIDLADKVIIVVNQNKKSVFATEMLLNNINCNNKEKYYFICNDYKEEEKNFLDAGDYKAVFPIGEYVQHINDISEADIRTLSENKDFKRIVYLIS